MRYPVTIMIALGLIAASLLTLATGQDCETLIEQCMGGLDADDLDFELDEGSDALLQFCNALTRAGSCLDALDSNCYLSVVLFKHTFSDLCSVETPDHIQILQCMSDAETESLSSCTASASSRYGVSMDHCSYYTETSACHNTSFAQVCGAVADAAAAFYTGTLVAAARSALDALRTDYSLCPLLAIPELGDTGNLPVISPLSCNGQINACYGGNSFQSLFSSPLPVSTREVIHDTVCANLDSSQVCLAGITGNEDCQRHVEFTGLLFSHICASSYLDGLDGYYCYLSVGDSIYCDLLEYDGVSPIASFTCSAYTQHLECYDDEIDQYCLNGQEWAKGYFALTIVVPVAQYMSSDCALLQILGDNFQNNPSPPDISICQEATNLCYQGYDISFLTEETLPSSFKELQWSGLCAAHAESGDCLARVSGQQDCGIYVDVARALHGFICANSYSDIQLAFQCMGDRTVNTEGLCVGLPVYDGRSDMADFQCRYYTAQMICINREIMATCETDTARDAMDLVALYTPYTLAPHLHDDCPLLRPVNDGVSGPVSSAWLTTGLLLAGVAMMRMLTT